uniref:C-type lectin domain-containing protein n=1 Tax=Globodera pallida TaxID=36090 RepID=A0A183C2U0_GLOPA
MLSRIVPAVVAAATYILLALTAVPPLAKASARRLSQLENAQPPRSPDYANSAVDESEQFEQQQQQKQQFVAVCPDGWLNFRDEACFYGLHQIQLPFYYGAEACAQIKANFSSVHSMDEFRVIATNFDLRHFWIGIFFGSSRFEDGTKVDQEVFEQLTPLVPWAPPQMPKGFVCRANRQFIDGNERDGRNGHGKRRRQRWRHNGT